MEPGTVATEALAKKRDALDPADTLGELECLHALDADNARFWEREERPLNRLARNPELSMCR